MSLFVSKKSLDAWLADYAVSHQNPTNKRIHWLCVPVIFLCVVALLWLIHPALLIAVAVAALWFYLRLSVPLALLMLTFMVLCVLLVHFSASVLWFWVVLFVVAWIGQFIGHKIEGAKPSFFEDLQFLLIGPAWVANDLLKKFTKR